jgi:hypothetical protein
MVVASIALIAALVGTAAALPGRKVIDKNDLKPNVVKSKHIKNGQVRSVDVQDGGIASPDLAADLQPRFARVSAAGVVDLARSSNVPAGSVTIAAGAYCFSLPYTPKNAQVTGEITAGPPPVDGVVSVDPATYFGLCPATAEAEVIMYVEGGPFGAPTPAAFYIRFG